MSKHKKEPQGVKYNGCTHCQGDDKCPRCYKIFFHDKYGKKAIMGRPKKWQEVIYKHIPTGKPVGRPKKLNNTQLVEINSS